MPGRGEFTSYTSVPAPGAYHNHRVFVRSLLTYKYFVTLGGMHYWCDSEHSSSGGVTERYMSTK